MLDCLVCHQMLFFWLLQRSVVLAEDEEEMRRKAAERGCHQTQNLNPTIRQSVHAQVSHRFPLPMGLERHRTKETERYAYRQTETHRQTDTKTNRHTQTDT